MGPIWASVTGKWKTIGNAALRCVTVYHWPFSRLLFSNLWLKHHKFTWKRFCTKLPGNPSDPCRDTLAWTKEMNWLMDGLISNATQSKRQNCAVQFQTQEPKQNAAKILVWSPDISSPAERGVRSQAVGDFVPLHSQEASFKPRLLSLLCSQLKNRQIKRRIFKVKTVDVCLESRKVHF